MLLVVSQEILVESQEILVESQEMLVERRVRLVSKVCIKRYTSFNFHFSIFTFFAERRGFEPRIRF